MLSTLSQENKNQIPNFVVGAKFRLKYFSRSIQGVLDLEPLLNKSDHNYISFSERVRKIVDEKQYPKTGKDVVRDKKYI